MEAKNVKNNIVLMLFIVVWHTCSHGQEKYLLFDAKKDSIVQLDSISYYKIDKNLFDIDRYSEIDTINLKQSNSLKFSSVEGLWKEGKELFLKISEQKNLFIETYNEIFEKIYVIEKISNCEYKRTRVWWIDY